jgi:hypothetical protein
MGRAMPSRYEKAQVRSGADAGTNCKLEESARKPENLIFIVLPG